jgi:hypothetical protein
MKPHQLPCREPSVAPRAIPYAQSHEMMPTALTDLLDAGVEAGTIRSDIGAADISAALTGVALAFGRSEQRGQAERLLDPTLDGRSTDRR